MIFDIRKKIAKKFDWKYNPEKRLQMPYSYTRKNETVDTFVSQKLAHS